MSDLGNNPTDWSRDRFGQPMEATKRYFEKRESFDYHPVENETVSGYVRRIANYIKKWEDINTSSHIYGRKTWFTHKNPSNCWLCDGITIMWIMYETYNLISTQLPNNGDLHVFTYDKQGKLAIKDNTSF